MYRYFENNQWMLCEPTWWSKDKNCPSLSFAARFMLALKWLPLFWVLETSLDRSTNGSHTAWDVTAVLPLHLFACVCLFAYKTLRCSVNMTNQLSFVELMAVTRTSGSIDSVVQWSTVKYRIFRASERSGLIITEMFRKHDFPHTVLHLSNDIF